MPDRGDLGVCGMEGCDGEGEHELVCNNEDCGGTVGYLCDFHIAQLESRLRRGSEANMKRAQERNRREREEDDD